jgi:hypothetical protein
MPFYEAQHDIGQPSNTNTDDDLIEMVVLKRDFKDYTDIIFQRLVQIPYSRGCIYEAQNDKQHKRAPCLQLTEMMVLQNDRLFSQILEQIPHDLLDYILFEQQISIITCLL